MVDFYGFHVGIYIYTSPMEPVFDREKNNLRKKVGEVGLLLKHHLLEGALR